MATRRHICVSPRGRGKRNAGKLHCADRSLKRRNDMVSLFFWSCDVQWLPLRSFTSCFSRNRALDRPSCGDYKKNPNFSETRSDKRYRWRLFADDTAKLSRFEDDGNKPHQSRVLALEVHPNQRKAHMGSVNWIFDCVAGPSGPLADLIRQGGPTKSWTFLRNQTCVAESQTVLGSVIPQL